MLTSLGRLQKGAKPRFRNCLPSAFNVLMISSLIKRRAPALEPQAELQRGVSQQRHSMGTSLKQRQLMVRRLLLAVADM
jgi:hypothetical protein